MAAERRAEQMEAALVDHNARLTAIAGTVEALQGTVENCDTTYHMVVNRIETVESTLTDLTIQLRTFSDGLAAQKARFAESVGDKIDKCKAALQHVVDEAKTEFMKLHGDVNTLHEKTAAAFTKVEDKVREMEELGPQRSSDTAMGKGYIPTKHQIPKPFVNKDEEWRKWQDDTSDYLDSINIGMRKLLKHVEKTEGQLDEEWLAKAWASFPNPEKLVAEE